MALDCWAVSPKLCRQKWSLSVSRSCRIGAACPVNRALLMTPAVCIAIAHPCAEGTGCFGACARVTRGRAGICLQVAWNTHDFVWDCVCRHGASFGKGVCACPVMPCTPGSRSAPKACRVGCAHPACRGAFLSALHDSIYATGPCGHCTGGTGKQKLGDEGWREVPGVGGSIGTPLPCEGSQALT